MPGRATYVFRSGSERQTVALGKRFARFLEAGSVVALTGELGSGKTTLVKGLAAGLGVRPGEVKSPTFVFFHVYAGKYPVYHFDLYRLGKAAELTAIGFEEFVSERSAVSVIEWAERAGERVPRERIEIRLTDEGRNRRNLYVSARGRQSRECVARFMACERPVGVS
jgi:tRNA threonylcarbamoyladenosine biosynthesis protein TsaE